jgi:tRNA-dihydrouridine synthase B
VKLGRLELKNEFILAPLESVSDAAFRHICFELGASLTFTEMIRARGIVRNNKSTLDLIDTFDPHIPTGIQLLVTGENELLESLQKIEKLSQTSHPHFRNLCAIDLNFGCPSPDVIQVGAGPALLKRAKKLEKIFHVLSEFKKSTSLNIGAVGAKIRLGLNGKEKDDKVYLPIVEVANRYLDFLTVHARHARQGSESPAEWSAIAEAKRVATIPLIANGDIFSLADFQKAKSETNCDGALIARGAIRNPLVFKELSSGSSTDSTLTLGSIEHMEQTYFSLAKQFGTKEKYLTWHREGFERMRKRIQSGTMDQSLPTNSNL